jgi:hypothetical protein
MGLVVTPVQPIKRALVGLRPHMVGPILKLGWPLGSPMAMAATGVSTLPSKSEYPHIQGTDNIIQNK